jgi:hemerythrin-like domain-containing protein
MKATDLLEEQHREVRDLFKRIEGASGPEQRSLFAEIASNLVAHDAIEREIFYPACEQALGMTDELGEALVEHGVVEFCLFEADEAKPDQFRHKCTVLREMLDHHIDEEEGEFFPKVAEALGDAKLESLGQEMQRRFQEAKRNDYHRRLHENLRQVLGGAMKTKPAAASTKGGPSKLRQRSATNKRAGGRASAKGVRSKGKQAARSTQRSAKQRNGARRHA